MTDVIAKLDDIGRPAWITVMVLGFIVFWPLGLATLAYLMWSGRMGCGSMNGRGRWHNHAERHADAGQRRWRHGGGFERSSGNVAFDEYRAETLKRLNEEQDEFKAFLDKLRMAKDKAEFDQFMADRRNNPPSGTMPQTGPQSGPPTKL